MNYGDPAQQQQYYVQRMPQQAQRMAFPPQQQQIQQSSAGMAVQQQPQPQQSRQQAMIYATPHPQQPMMRVPQHIYAQQGMGPQQQQQQLKSFLQSLPTGLQQQINAEKDPERKKQLIQMIQQRQQQQHQQQMFEQQQQHMAMMANNQPGPMAMRPMAAHRMPMVQTTNGTQTIIFATTTTAQQQQSMQQQTPQNVNVHFQRIPSQSSFVTHSSSPTPMGTANYQPRVVSAATHPPQLFMAGQQQMPGGGGMQQIRGATTTNAPMPGNQTAQFVQQQQQLVQQQFHRQQQQFEPMPSHLAAQQQQLSKPTDNNSFTSNYQIGTAPPAMDNANAQNRMAPATMAVVKTEIGGLTNAPVSAPNVRSSAGTDGVSSVDSHPPSVGTASGGTASGRPGSVQQQQQSGNTQHQVDTEEPEYKALMKQLCRYHADVKRLLGRIELDILPGVETKIKASLTNVIQVMEGTRKGGVTKSLLQKLLSNVQTVLKHYHISRHLFNIAKKLTTLAPPQNGAASANGAGGGGTTPTTTAPKEEQFNADPWRNVRHLAIKLTHTIPLPDAVLTILEGGKCTAEKQQKKADGESATGDTMGDSLTTNASGGGDTNGRKRIGQQNDEEDEQNGPPTKKSLLEISRM